MTTPPIIHHDAYEVDIGTHVFPTQKYRLVRDRLLSEGAVAQHDLLRPERAPDADIALVHTPDYLEKLTADTLSPQERYALEVPFSDALRDAMWVCAGGTTLTGRMALQHGTAVHLGGGFHHAFADHGEGFCLINDVAIAIRVLRRDDTLRRALVLDLDVHHGNGTAAIFATDPDVFTCSFHQDSIYPLWKPPSDLDVGLHDRTGDEEYHAEIERHLPRILDAHRPDLLFYLAGADPYHLDRLGGLALTLEGLRHRDDLVFRFAREAGVPVAVTLAGGYAEHPSDTVSIHCGTVRAALEASAARG